jgi:hypothetical protein
MAGWSSWGARRALWIDDGTANSSHRAGTRHRFIPQAAAAHAVVDHGRGSPDVTSADVGALTGGSDRVSVLQLGSSSLKTREG